MLLPLVPNSMFCWAKKFVKQYYNALPFCFSNFSPPLPSRQKNASLFFFCLGPQPWQCLLGTYDRTFLWKSCDVFQLWTISTSQSASLYTSHPPQEPRNPYFVFLLRASAQSWHYFHKRRIMSGKPCHEMGPNLNFFKFKFY